MREFCHRDSGLSGGNTSKHIEDSLSGLVTGDRLVVAAVESGQTVQVRLHVRQGETGDQGIDVRLAGKN